MDQLDDSEKNAKVSDSAYSNSCSNSQSRRSHSSKSTHSGSNSSGSSGYGGKPSARSDNSGQPVEKRVKDKDGKNKKKAQAEKAASVVAVPAEVEESPPEPVSVVVLDLEPTHDAVAQTPSQAQVQTEKGSENMDISTPESSSNKDEVGSCNMQLFPSSNYVTTRSTTSSCALKDGFSCLISMHDGVVMYTTSTITTTLGFPKDMWIGRSFIDFVHPRDRNTFASHITSGLALPKNVNGTLEKASSQSSVCTMVCRIRRYRSLANGFSLKDRAVTFMPFLLKLSFKNICDEDGKVTYLDIQATPFFSAFKTPNEIVLNAVPFVIRHAANGNLEYIDTESVPYLGYLPQDLADKDALQLYHPDDMPYLRQVYEAIVKEGGVPRSLSYRLLAQNGDFLKVQTEWSSFINPWSRKLEFVIGKHHIVEGPKNPDVFQAPDLEKNIKVSEEEKSKIQALRDSIVRTMNEVLTKPAEMAKQQMTKRCQDLATFMESLMEDEPKLDEELRLEIQDADNSYYERDSVMLGGISPHHDHNDSKSSTETPLSYNQLNYKETLQRYFNSHQPFTDEENNSNTEDCPSGTKKFKLNSGICMSPVAQKSGEAEMSSCESSCTAGCSSGSSNPYFGDRTHPRLTESLLTKHNTDMEKELMKTHRETRSSIKGEREKSNETRKKKKEHLARCNAAFQPTAARNVVVNESETQQPHGVKRSSKQQDLEPSTHKHHCSMARQSNRRQSTSAAPVMSSSTITTTVAAQWPGSSVNGMNTFLMGVGIPQQVPIISPITAIPGSPIHYQPLYYPVWGASMPSVGGAPAIIQSAFQSTENNPNALDVRGMIPMYYATPAAVPAVASTSEMNNALPPISTEPQHQGFLNQMQCMMYGQTMYGSPFMYTPMNPQMAYQTQQNSMTQTTQTNSMNLPLGLASSNYEEACKPSLPLKLKGHGSQWRDMKNQRNQGILSKNDQGSGDSNSSSNALNRSTEAVPHKTPSRGGKTKTSDETVDRTDGESSYSSFYSSFFKTESGSAEDSSGDAKKTVDQNKIKKIAARPKMEPPWMEQVCMTSELVYKYQILTKSMNEVLESDKAKMTNFEQPSLVNEQLGQLYLDLQLEGVATRLTLEEGITSSSSSGEESTTITSKVRRKREYSKLVVIYEEDAPLPPAPDEQSCTPSVSTVTDTH